MLTGGEVGVEFVDEKGPWHREPRELGHPGTSWSSYCPYLSPS